MNQILEMCMLIFFGCSWPISLAKSIRSKTAKGKSVVFSILVVIGYLCGIASKLVSGNVTYVVFFYVLNFVMVSLDIIVYFRNAKLDAARESAKAA